jgi:hypothetical protein
MRLFHSLMKRLSFDTDSSPVFERFANLDIDCQFDDLSDCLQRLAELHTARLNPVPMQESLLLTFQ